MAKKAKKTPSVNPQFADEAVLTPEVLENAIRVAVDSSMKPDSWVLTSTPMRSVNPFFPKFYQIGDWVLLVGENRILEITMTYKSSLFAEYRIQDSPDKIFDYKAVDVESKQELTLYPNKYEFIQVPYNCNPTTAKALYGKKPTNK